MITILRETTDWDYGGYYHVNAKGHLVGYQGVQQDYKEFSEPMKRFSKSGRKFEVSGTREDSDNSQTWQIKGSSGRTYTVGDYGGLIKCNCSGFTYRGKCKHVTDVTRRLCSI